LPQNLGPTPSNGQYYPGAIQGNLYRGGNQAPVATALPAGVPTAYTGGLVLSNPLTSAVNLVLQSADAAFVVAQTNAAVISVGASYSPVTAISGTLTVVPVQPAVVGTTSEAQGVLYSSASITLPAAPKVAIIVGAVDTGALTTAPNAGKLSASIQGGMVIPPGGQAVILSSAAGTASSFMGSFTWSELPAGATA
jgi:hypothetical protein